MLKRFAARNYKSLGEVDVELPRLAVLYGASGAGKSDLVEAIQALARIGTERTLADAFGRLRGHPPEAFAAGLPTDGAEADAARSLLLSGDVSTPLGDFRYRVEPELDAATGELGMGNELLAALTTRGRVSQGRVPAIERVGDRFRIRRKRKPSGPREEPVGQNHSILSDRSLTGENHPWLDAVRGDLLGWRAHAPEPRAMREIGPLGLARDIGPRGEHLARFLWTLASRKPAEFEAVIRAARAIAPTVDDVRVDFDERCGTFDLRIARHGVERSARVASAGTLRALALAAVAANPWAGSLVIVEEPELGQHPRRVERIALLLAELAASGGPQVVVTTHSPHFPHALRKADAWLSDSVALFTVRREGAGTRIERMDPAGPLFEGAALEAVLAAADADGA